jgi:quinol-cytochrome oxidoreductase complex cytochrome b subunit
MPKSSSRAPRVRELWDRVYPWLDERLGLHEVVDYAKKKTVPQHRHTFWYYWGGVSLFLFGVQAITGCLLLVYYRPGTEAYDSVQRITQNTDFGWLVRSVHAWAANLMVLSVLVHMFRVFFWRAYRKPREFGWWTGLAMLGVVMVFGFSGYLLPMDDLSFFATKVGLEIPCSMPIAGPIVSTLVRGGPEVTEVTMQRFFALHVFVLPALLAGLLGVHLYLIMNHGSSIPQSEEAVPTAKRRSIAFFPSFALRDAIAWIVVLSVLIVLAAAFPWKLGPQADPLASAPKGIHPEWYFMSQYQVLKVLGNVIPGQAGEFAGVGLFTAAGLLWGLIPLLDREGASVKRARTIAWIGLVAVVGLIAMTVWGYAGLE